MAEHLIRCHTFVGMSHFVPLLAEEDINCDYHRIDDKSDRSDDSDNDDETANRMDCTGGTATKVTTVGVHGPKEHAG